MRHVLALMLAFGATPAGAAAWSDPVTPSQRLDRLDATPRVASRFDDDADETATIDHPNVSMLAIADASRAKASVPARVDLEIDPMAGHRSFETMRGETPAYGWRLAASGDPLGVGLTGAYGVPLVEGVMATPFVSLDYNRVDSARTVDARSPQPYMTDNADTGLTASAGAEIAWQLGKSWQLSGFGAALAGSGPEYEPHDAASIGARLVSTVGESRLNALSYDFGVSASYALSSDVRVTAGMVQSVGGVNGGVVAARISLTARP